jgi:16S rRNA (guanine966-N2)-methyltransferase
MALRVIAGEAGGRRLVAPKGDVRPTADRVKESLFAALGADRIEGAVVLDLYAGSGALGIEALSRGAASAVFVDKDRRAHDALRTNLATTGFAARAQVRQSPVASFLGRPAASPETRPETGAETGPETGKAFDLVFLDPPYDLAAAELTRALETLARPGVLAEAATVVIETRRDAPPVLPADWTVGWTRTYGDTLLTVATA